MKLFRELRDLYTTRNLKRIEDMTTGELLEENKQRPCDAMDDYLSRDVDRAIELDKRWHVRIAEAKPYICDLSIESTCNISPTITHVSLINSQRLQRGFYKAYVQYPSLSGDWNSITHHTIELHRNDDGWFHVDNDDNIVTGTPTGICALDGMSAMDAPNPYLVYKTPAERFDYCMERAYGGEEGVALLRKFVLDTVKGQQQ